MQILSFDTNGNVIDEENETPCKMEKSKMKIDIATIEHCALEAISDFVGSPYEYADSEEDEAKNMMKLTLGAVAGVLEFAENLKKITIEGDNDG